MRDLPDFEDAFTHENNFYLSCDDSRIGKILTHYELFKMIKDLPGDIVECGVFAGVSLARFVSFRNLLEHPNSRKIIGFDTFDKFPTTNFEQDKLRREQFIVEAGSDSISKKQLLEVLERKNNNHLVELIEGDITRTIPDYVSSNPQLKISLLHLDVDIFEPSVTILEHLYPKVVSGGIIILDDYGQFPGETKAVDDYLKNKNIKIHKFPFSRTPCYIIKP
jgi:hypothetical protein